MYEEWRDKVGCMRSRGMRVVELRDEDGCMRSRGMRVDV
jgi:hypothetical protein